MRSDAFSTTPEPSGNGYLQSLMSWQMLLGRSLMQAQCGQWEMMAAWQRSIGNVQRELMDQWICRFGGGAPLDG
ncbi:hypothetical protein [Variovorax paradoxus]|uniref:hypothetical protein n=1 Tax=Variovorax paradoxus TaxID=34073 RepID=UPI0027888FC8|nr:hypothetical protein [Variovorax paradoxus]MDP9927938.1 hypothetical protein [Variovorax paradoxus]